MKNKNLMLKHNFIFVLFLLLLFFLQTLTVIHLLRTHEERPCYNFKRCYFRISTDTILYLSCKVNDHSSKEYGKQEARRNDSTVNVLKAKNPGSKPGPSTSYAWTGPGGEPGIGKEKTKNKKNNKTKNPKNINNKEVGNTAGDENESDHNKARQKARNSETRAINGNIPASNPTGQGGSKKALSILQVNTGNGKWTKSASTLKLLIRHNNPDIVIISESNFEMNNRILTQTRNTDFKEYAFEDKILPGSSLARMTIMIRTSINYIRMSDLENETNSTAVICIKSM